jgi:hypothetical protein
LKYRQIINAVFATKENKQELAGNINSVKFNQHEFATNEKHKIYTIFQKITAAYKNN